MARNGGGAQRRVNRLVSAFDEAENGCGALGSNGALLRRIFSDGDRWRCCAHLLESMSRAQASSPSRHRVRRLRRICVTRVACQRRIANGAVPFSP